MFIEKQDKDSQEKYIRLLKIVGALSKLSSDKKDTPYLYYRMAENIFCQAFNADNLSRSDISIDAQKNGVGIGLKTFLYKNGKCLEKVAEFNRERNLFKEYENRPITLVKKIAEYRNKRISSTAGMFNIKTQNLVYHCVARKEKKFIIYETPMKKISINDIVDVKQKQNTITFNDKLNEYSFNLSKSTLFKRFNINSSLDIPVDILENPFTELEKLFHDINIQQQTEEYNLEEKVILPLYSPRGRTKSVETKSGLNQWNAQGRERHADEVYIPIPIWIHRQFPNFFPDRKTPFMLKLPTKKHIEAKVCQDNNKALMSTPNKALGKWILRDILQIKEDTLITYDMLEEIGIDSVEIIKHTNTEFSINFKETDSYEEFKRTYE